MAQHSLYLTAALCLGLVGAPCGYAAFTAESVALSGTAATGISGQNYASFLNANITAGGNVWFNGRTNLVQDGDPVDGLWYKASGSVSLFVRDYSAYTDPNFRRLSNFANILVSPTLGTFTNDGSTIYAGTSSAAPVLSATGGSAPGAGTGVTFSTLTSFTRAMNASGTSVATYLLSNSTAALYAGTVGNYNRIAQSGSGFTEFRDVTINSAGVVNANVYSNSVTANNGIWQGTSSANFTQIVGAGQSAVGIASASFDQFVDLSAVNASGQVAFVARASGQSAASAWGIWTTATSGNALQLLARTGAVAAGVSDGATYAQQFGYNTSVRLTNDGRVAFVSSLSNTTAGRDTGIWHGAVGGLKLVAREGQNIAGLSANVLLGDVNFSGLAINNSGLVAFTASLTAVAGFESEVTDANNGGLFAWSEYSNALTLVARKGDLFDTGAGNKTIASFNMVTGSSGNDGRAFALNDSGSLAVIISFTDATSGVFKFDLATLSAIPEPATTAAIAGAFMLGLACWRRRHSA